MKPGILVATKGWDVESWASRIRALLPDRPVICTDRSGVFHGSTDELAKAHYILAWKPRQDVLDRLASLRVIFSLGAGVDHLFGLQCVPDVPITRIVDPDLTSRMTEYVVWQALHHLRRGDAYARQQREHVWRDLPQPAARHLTVGLMGLGVLGTNAANALRGLGFNVRGWVRSPRGAPGIEIFAGADGLSPFLAGTDVLVALLPLTSDTRGLVDLGLLRRLRRTGPLGGAVFINAGRGGSHVEADLAQALREGTLAGASLDVFEAEPLASDSPLWDLPNVAITPHVAAVSDPEALTSQIAEQILAFERGEPLRNLVDPRREY